MDKINFQAVIFDLDGVITTTALVHSTAWREMFNDYLKQREKRFGKPFKEFNHTDDYLPYVDGKPRYKGVASFLESRNIDIPFGDPSDGPGQETVCGLGNKKNEFFNQILERDGVQVYQSSVDFIRDLKKAGVRIGVASSSKNCMPILERAGIPDLFETRVDGVVSAELGLKGKPEPDIFTVACDNLGVEYELTVIVEDAVSGVQAGRNGNFGLTLGIAREGNSLELKKNGADIVVEDISELGGIETVREWFANGLEKEKWSVQYPDYDPEKEKSREALLAVGNGYFGTRGAMEECSAGESNYPGTYITCLYNRRISIVAGRDIENEDYVNCPNWLPVTFKVEDGPWFDPNRWIILHIDRRLSFGNGCLVRTIIVADSKGREFRIESRRMASMDDPHMAGIEYSVTPVNFSGLLTIRSAIDGAIINDGVVRYRQLDQHHLEPVSQGGEGNIQYVHVVTSQSGIDICEAAGLKVFLNDQELAGEWIHHQKAGYIESEYEANIQKGQTLRLEKIVCITTSRETLRDDLVGFVQRKCAGAGSFDKILLKSAGRWNELWNEMDISVVGDRFAQKLIRMHIYHLLVTASPHYDHLDAAIAARGLHGEAYRGHIFWDELYILPFYHIHLPEVSKASLIYRCRRIDKAREYAASFGYKGAMFPWQSGSDGREETQVIHLNPISGEWGEDYSSLQRHVNIAIACNIWMYYWITQDESFMLKHGAELYFEICRFWVSKCKLDNKTGKYSIGQVMGPDEFHEHVPGSDEGGLIDNAYTNIMVSWMLEKAQYLVDHLDQDGLSDIRKTIGFTREELEEWDKIRHALKLVINDEGVISQFDGYFELLELDWDEYREKYGNIHRMDRILKAEGKSPDKYKVAKQADTLMTFYNLDQYEVKGIIEQLGYQVPADLLEKNFDYYIKRTSHGSTLSRIVHACLANQLKKKELGWTMYMEALSSDYVDIQGGTTAEGIHAGVMGATVLFALNSLAGLDFRKEHLVIAPDLPELWKNIKFNFAFRKNYYIFEITSETIRMKVKSHDNEPVRVVVIDSERYIKSGIWNEFKY